MSTSAQAVEEALRQTTDAFDRSGLTTHESQVMCENGAALGCRLDGRRRLTRATLERFWRLRRGLDRALSVKKLPGRAWRIIMGHVTYIGLLRRDVLSCLSAIYNFIEVNLDVSAPLWPSARLELEGFRDLLVLVSTGWQSSWIPLVLSTDASEFAYGITATWWSPSEVAAAGRCLERRRFLRQASSKARAHFGAQACLEAFDAAHGGAELEPDPDQDDIDAEWAVDPAFPEIPRSKLVDDKWAVLVRRRWIKPGNICY